MKLLGGISGGAVLQRGEKGCDVLFRAEARGRIRASAGEVRELGNGAYRFTGIPAGGPYEVTFADDESEVTLKDIYVGDLWILAGQSNMEGAGTRREKDVIYDGAPRGDVRALYMDGHWDAARSRLHQQWLHTDRGIRERYRKDNGRHLSFYGSFSVETTSGVGPGLYIALRLRELTGVPQGVIPCGYGGSSLRDWSPENSAPGALYLPMIEKVREAGSRVKGVFWYQGESEANAEGNRLFTERMERLVASIRKDTYAGKLPFVQAQIGPTTLPQLSNPEANRFWHGIKELQRRMPERIPGTATVPVTTAYLQDMIHLDAESQEELGRRMAEEMHRLVSGEGTAPPEPAGVETFPHPAKKNCTVIALSFRDLRGGLACRGRPFGFSLTLGEEEPWEYPYRYLSEIRLEGERVLFTVEDDYVPLEKAYLWYGAGCGTFANVTDGDGRPLPAFGPYKVIRDR